MRFYKDLNELETQLWLSANIYNLAAADTMVHTEKLSKMLYVFRDRLSPFTLPPLTVSEASRK